MKETPILFNTEMTKAVLDGRKTQTRRVIKPQPDEVMPPDSYLPDRPYKFVPNKGTPHNGEFMQINCPYGQVGDRLWVRETFLPWINTADGSFSHVAAFRADGYELEDGEKWKPSIFMPRAASRITLEITDIRVERVQDISHNDIQAEGLGFASDLANEYDAHAQYTLLLEQWSKLWNSINKKRGYGWEVNPWVWCVSFKRIDK